MSGTSAIKSDIKAEQGHCESLSLFNTWLITDSSTEKHHKVSVCLVLLCSVFSYLMHFVLTKQDTKTFHFTQMLCESFLQSMRYQEHIQQMESHSRGLVLRELASDHEHSSLQNFHKPHKIQAYACRIDHSQPSESPHAEHKKKSSWSFKRELSISVQHHSLKVVAISVLLSDAACSSSRDYRQRLAWAFVLQRTWGDNLLLYADQNCCNGLHASGQETGNKW